ncbi:MAG TPA: 4Fe-4S dicluster domain-containing protein [Thermoplasmatales archaeon]|nr:MAG: (4Fe-4S)-binding protein [Thermoplasmata archaeon]HHH80114.1 4Fe-4S dicluster domain-containing protein [Thermoplasmatales archaeon]
MREIVVISGKGGTGKTSITAGFASLAKDTVFADCDVDAPDLHLILKPKIKETIGFHGLKLPVIDRAVCTNCKRCYESCKFDAIDEDINVIKERCEGCGVCTYVCPVNAIDMVDRDSGFVYISETRFGPMVHAILNTAEETSGKLVAEVRKNAKKLAEQENMENILIDGPPGIGCPVTSSITGVDLVLIVTEPTLSAIHDLERVLEVADHFSVPAVVCINKYDINRENTEKIEVYCRNNNVEVIGRIPYDTEVTEAMVVEKTIVEYNSSGRVSKVLMDMWRKIEEKLKS